MRNRIVFVVLMLIATLVISLFVAVNLPSVPAEPVPEKEPFFVGVEIGWRANVTECKAVIDEVKNYSNLLILANSLIMCDEVSLNETCDYAYQAGMYIIIWFDNPLNAKYDQYFPNRVFYYPFLWTMKAQERYGDKFLGAYFEDETGGHLLDNGNTLSTNSQICYTDLADSFVRSGYSDLEILSYISPKINCSTFIADYGLHWFDYKAGYDVVLAEFTKNNSRPLAVALCRGAAQLQNKDWGIMITWEYEAPPYTEPADKLYDDLVFAYHSGAKYVAVFDSWSEDHVNSTLTDDHLDALKNFWEYVQQNPDKHGSLKADTALVLPDDYGFGFRNPRDTIWGYTAADNWTEKMYYDVYGLLDEYDSRLDVVYDDPEFAYMLTECYSEVLMWTAGPDAESYPVVNLDTGMGYSTIQEAISTPATNHGHTIFVKAGVYNENVYVSKAISLVGEDKETTIISGDSNDTALSISFLSAISYYGEPIVSDKGVNVTGFTIRNGGNTTSNVGGGIHLIGAYNSNISGNTVTGCNFGVHLQDSGNTTLRNNNIFGNVYNFGVSGSTLSSYVHDVDSSNTVDGKPICYWVNEHDREVPSDVGYVAVVNCTGVTVQNFQLSNNYNGLLIAYTRDSVIADNTLTNNWEGTRFDSSSGIVLSGNEMHDNEYNLVVNGKLANDFGTTNTIDGKSIIYWVDQHDRVVPSDAGYVVLIDCTGITVKNLQLSNNLQGVLLINSNNTVITQNTITNQVNGIELRSSSNNTITNNFISESTSAGINLNGSDNNSFAGNTIFGNEVGILFVGSSGNNIYRNNITANNNALYFPFSFIYQSTGTPVNRDNTIKENNITLNQDYIRFETYSDENNRVYHNNFINNTQQQDDTLNVNNDPGYLLTEISWDNDSEGNYWSNYQDTYTNATEVNDSGVWDTPYIGADYHVVDWFPLVQPFTIPISESP